MMRCLQVYENALLIPASYQISEDSATESPLSEAQTSRLTAQLRGLYKDSNLVMLSPTDCVRLMEFLCLYIKTYTFKISNSSRQ